MAIYTPRVLRIHSLLFLLTLMFGFSGSAIAQQRPPYLPDRKLTPGDTVNVTKSDLCDAGNPNRAGAIPITVKRQVFDRYGIKSTEPGGYNVERLIPTNLGGSNSIKNLWPQPLSGEWNYSLKNRLEHRLHKMVCSGELDLKNAQMAITEDWVSAYKKYEGQYKRKRSRRH
jgi:hypothetical protein